MKSDAKNSLSGSVVAIEPGTEWFKLVEVTRNHEAVKVKRVVVRRATEVEPLAGPNLLKALGLGDLSGEPVV